MGILVFFFGIFHSKEQLSSDKYLVRYTWDACRNTWGLYV